MRTSPYPRWLPLLLVTLLVSLPMLAACQNSNDAAAGETHPSYDVGEPISDSSIAVIVSSEQGDDTLTTDSFQMRIERVQNASPALQNDVAQMTELRRTIVENFVLEHVLLAEAEQQGLTADSAMIAMRVQQIQRQAGGEEQLQQALAERGLTKEAFRQRLQEMMLMSEVQRKLAAEVDAPTAEELEAFRQEQSVEVRAQHILFPLPPNAPATAEDSVHTLAEAVLDSIKAGEATFAEMAQRYSKDGTAARGGDLGYFRRIEMLDPFAEAAFALKDSGDVVEAPVRTRYGLHLIRKTGERESTPMDSLRASQMLAQQQRRDAVRQGMYRLRAEATVRINPNVVEGVALNKPFDPFEQRF